MKFLIVLKNTVIGIMIFILLVIIAVSIHSLHVSRRAMPNYNRPFVLEGLRDRVEVYRDEYAIPHIIAQNEHDLYVATGFVMAQDRLWQMDLLRRVTMGRLSEILGKRMVGADQLLKALRITEKSEQILARSDQVVIDALEAFSLGVNLFMEQHRKKLPTEFGILRYRPEPWEPVHSVNLIGYMAWDLSGSWNTEILLHKLRPLLDEEKFRQLLPNPVVHSTFVHPDYSMDVPVDMTVHTVSSEALPVVLPGETENMFTLLDHAGTLRGLGLEVFSGSNSWVVSGEHTITGKPLFANDMHLGFGSPGIWLQIHQVVEGGLKVAGVALPGQPFVIVGHNENIAWGMTNLQVDEMDFYLETTDPMHPDHYLFNGEWTPMKVVHEQIAVSWGRTEERINRFTHRGPVISGFKSIDDQVISMRWTGNETSNELQSIFLLNRAANWDDFRVAVSGFGAVSQNVTYADVNGNIGQQTAGGVPLRRQGSGMFIYPGETDEYDWSGILPFHVLPYEYNPDRGMVSAANNSTVDENYPYLIGHWFDVPNRIDRIRELLEEKDIYRAPDFRRIMIDTYSPMAERTVPKLLAILMAADNHSANEQQAIRELAAWDYHMSVESIAASVFEQFFLAFVKNVMTDETGEDLFRQLNHTLIRNLFENVWQNPTSGWVNNVNTPHTETFGEVVLQSFREAIGLLETGWGGDPNKWRWGKLHQLKIVHPLGTAKLLDLMFDLNFGPFPLGGSFHTVSNASYSFHKPFNVIHGASQRHVFNLAEWADSYVITPTGTCGIPANDHYLDQTETFVKGRFYRKHWYREDIIENALYITVLDPHAPENPDTD